MDIWKPILGYEDSYLISEYGDIIKIRENNEKVYKLQNSYIRKGKKKLGRGRRYTSLTKDNKSKIYTIAFLVASTFLGARPKGLTVDHIDNNSLNDHYTNLQYLTAKDNLDKYLALNIKCSYGGRIKKVKEIKDKDLSSEQIKNVMSRLYLPVKELAILYDVSSTTMYKIIKELKAKGY